MHVALCSSSRLWLRCSLQRPCRLITVCTTTPTLRLPRLPVCVSLRRFANRSYDPISSKEADDVVETNLRKLTSLVDGTDGQKERTTRWRKDPFKVKRQHYTRHMLNLTRKSKLTEAAEVFEHMKNAGVYPDTAAYNILIAGYGRCGNIREAFHLFNEMKKRALVPSNHSYCSLFNACSNAGTSAKEYLLKVQEEMERKSIVLNGIATNAHLSAMASCGLVDEVFEAYSKMSNRRLTPDLQTFGTLLLAASKDHKCGLDRAQKVWFDLLAQSDVEPDTLCYNLVLLCMREAGTMTFTKHSTPPKEKSAENNNGAFRSRSETETEEIVSFALSPEHKVQVHVDRGGRRWLTSEGVLALLAAMKRKGAASDVRTFNLLTSLALDTTHVLKVMEEAGVSPDRKFWIGLIRSSALRSDLQEAKAILVNNDLQNDQHAWQAVAMGCLAKEEGLGLLEDMKVVGIKPNEFVLGTLVGNAAKQRAYEYLTLLLKVMKYEEVIPNTIIREMLERAANHSPDSPRLKKRHHGFKGYYTLWKTIMCPE